MALETRRLFHSLMILWSVTFLTAGGSGEGPRPGTAHQSGPYPTPVFDVFKYAAKGDSTTNDTAAIQAAIDACVGTGGTVYIHNGVFLTGALTLGSGMTFYVDASATLLGMPYSEDYERYYPELPRDYETRTHQWVRRSLIYAKQSQNLTLAGQGVIDLQASTWRKRVFDKDFIRSEKSGSQRPLILAFHRCSQLTVTDLKLRNSAFWCSAYDQCEHVRIENLEIYDDVIENNDGINVIDSSHVQVLNNKIWADDDNICLKSMSARGLSDVLIQGNVLYSARANAIKFGTDSSGPVENVKVYDNLVLFARHAAFAWESVDGARTRNLHIRNLEIHASGAPLFLVVGERGRGGFPPGAIQDVLIENVNASDTRQIWGMMIIGLPDPDHQIKNITIKNSRFEMGGSHKWPVDDPPEIGTRYPESDMFQALPAYAFFLRNVDGMRFENVQIGYRHSDLRPWLVSRDVKNLSQERVTEVGKLPPGEFKSSSWKTPFRMAR